MVSVVAFEGDWARVHHAYGRAGDVPGQLAGLVAGDPETRRAAVSFLTGSVYHQGTRWPASARVVGPLVALVGAPKTPDRATVLHILRAVALGDARDDELPFDPVRAFADAERVRPADEAAVLRVLFEEDDPDVDGVADIADAVALRWAADAYRAARRHTAAYLDWLRDPDPAVAALAAGLVVWFPGVPGVGEALAAVAGGAGPGGPRASANLGLAHLDGPLGERELGALTRGLGSTDEAVRVTAAVALARRLPAAPPEAALTVLIDADDRNVPGVVPGWDRPLRGHVSIALRRLGL